MNISSALIKPHPVVTAMVATIPVVKVKAITPKAKKYRFNGVFKCKAAWLLGKIH